MTRFFGRPVRDLHFPGGSYPGGMIASPDIRRRIFRQASWPALLFVFSGSGFLPTRIPPPACPLIVVNPVQVREQMAYALMAQDRIVIRHHVRAQRRLRRQIMRANQVLRARIFRPNTRPVPAAYHPAPETTVVPGNFPVWR